MELFKRFYRRYGIRRPSHMKNPFTNDSQALTLPRGSVFHYLPEDGTTIGVPSDHWSVKDTERLVMVDHVEELDPKANEGNPRTTAVIPASLTRRYHRRHRKLKPVRSLESNTKNPRTLLVANYGLLPQLYRYTTSFYSNYYRWTNIHRTMWSHVEELYGKVGRQHFVSVNLPTPLPSLTALRKAEARFSRTSLELFDSPEALFLLEVWKWIGEKREESHLSVMGEETFRHVNIIWIHDNRWIMINLGILDDWRKEGREGDVDPEVLQRYFLRVLMSLFESTTPVKESDEEDDEPEEEDTAEEEDEGSGGDHIEQVTEDDPEESVEKTFQGLDDGELEAELDALNDVILQEQQNYREKLNEELQFELSPPTLDGRFKEKATDLAEDGLLSAAEYRRMDRIAETYKTLPDPYTGKGSLLDQARINPEDLEIDGPTTFTDNDAILDKSMLETTIQDFDSRYTKNVMSKDVTNMVLGLQKAGVAVTGYEVEEIEDVANKYQSHTLRLTPVSGKPSTIRFKLPVIEEDGTYLANGVKYRLRKQRADVPIRKVKPERVALTSYYGKVFVDRSTKSVNDYGRWLTRQITSIGLDDADERVTDMRASNVFDQRYKLPRVYSVLSSHFRMFKAGGVEFFLEYGKRENHFGEEKVKGVETDELTVIGKKGRDLVVIDHRDTLYHVKDGDLKVLGKIEELIGIDVNKAPIDIAELKVFSKTVPLGVALAYYVGLDNLISLLDGEVRRVPTGERLSLGDSEVAIRFENESLVFSREDKLLTLVLGGFHAYRNVIKQYGTVTFNDRDVFYNVFEAHGLGNRHLKELELMRDMFIDPITEEILVQMEEPTSWLPLLLRAGELLLTDYSPDETDLEYMRIRGYERLPGTVYGELVAATRTYLAREGNANAAVEMSPHAVWQVINSDPSVSLVEDSNPIQNLKEKESVTYGGEGGRSKRSMVKRTRVYHPNDMGVISEATVDSGDVGINTSLTANPKFTNLRGMTSRYESEDDGPTRLLSTSALLSPGADADDPKRVNFISIQHGSGISAKGYRPTPLRTGYERVIAHRTDDLFAYTAKGKGKVTKVSKEAITVEYEDGSTRHIELGRRFGSAAGTIFPHEVTTDFKVGDTFAEGDAIAYNANFFTPDPLNPKEVLWKAGVMCKTAIAESSDTFEDSSVISEKIAKDMATGITKVRNLVFDFDQTVRSLVDIGTTVDPESILCTIEDSVTADNDLFNEDTLDTLRLLSSNTPRAKYGGVVEKIEVFYHGDKEDMSPTVRQIADKADRDLAKRSRALGKNVVTGSVDDSMRVDNQPLEMDQLVIKVYITENMPAGIGDKGVFGNQMKTVFARVMSGTNTTESGEDIDAIFGYQSISNRIVLSPEIMGTTNTLLRVLSKHVAKVYRGS